MQIYDEVFKYLMANRDIAKGGIRKLELEEMAMMEYESAFGDLQRKIYKRAVGKIEEEGITEFAFLSQGVLI